MTSKKWLKSCRKKLDAKLCKRIAKTLHREKQAGDTRRDPKIKSCSKSDLGVKRTIQRLASLAQAVHGGDGSGAEDRFYYLAEDIRAGLRSRCGPKFTKKVGKAAMRLVYK